MPAGRASNKTIWNADSIMEQVSQARMELADVEVMADRAINPGLMQAATRIGQCLNRIEKRALDARYDRWDEAAPE